MDESTRISALAQFHAAEYAAMMNSVSIWKTLQYALWPILLGFWLLLGQFSNKLLDYVVPWALAVVLPIGYLAYQAAAIDALHGVLLIERDVRPLAAGLVGTDRFWLHERVYRKTRSRWLLRVYAAWPPLFCFALAICALVYRAKNGGLLWQDWVGFAICAGMSLFVTFLTREERKLHEQIDAVVGTKAPR